MTQLSEEQQNRLKRIAHEAAQADPGRCLEEGLVYDPALLARNYRSHIDFLLSLLDSDSQAAGDRVLQDQESLYPERDDDWALRELADGWINAFERDGPHGFNQNARRVLDAISDDAATTMRDKCVAKLHQVRDNHLVSNNEHYEKGFNAALKCAELAMQFLTLEPGEM